MSRTLTVAALQTAYGADRDANIARTADLSYVRVEGGKHAMLRRGGTFERLAAEFTAATLLDDVRPSDLVDRVLAADAPLAI